MKTGPVYKYIGANGENKYADRLSKRLCYILRYGAVREGLTVHEHGWYKLYDQ